MTPEQIGLYQAVLDDLVANVADTDVLAEAKKGAILAAITALKQICNHPVRVSRRRAAARRSIRQARPTRGDRRVGLRRRRAHPHLHPLRHVGPAPCRPPHRGHRHADRLLRRQPGPRACAIASFTSSRPRTGPGAMVLSLEGRRHRAEPHRGEPRGALRPLVEPGGRGPGPRPRLAHRPEPHGHLPPPGMPGHHRRARRGDRCRQAPHRSAGAAEVELDRRSQRRSAAHRPRPAARRAAREDDR